MKPPVYFDRDADPSVIQGKRVAIIGYGNQGHAQALNLRDSGVGQIVVGNIDDGYKERAVKDGFRVMEIAEVAAWADTFFLLIPDEVQPDVFHEEIVPHLRPGDTLVVASGYNLAFGLFRLPPTLDVVMVAPRMVGQAVRARFLSGEAYPSFVSVEQDYSGTALATALSIARSIGATRTGSVGSSPLEEAALDLFAEQAVWPAILVVLRTAFEVLSEAGFSEEAILHELYLSREPLEIFRFIADQGLFAQLNLHSHTSQFGQLRAASRDDGAHLRERFARVLKDDILSGAFAREWSDIQARGTEQLEKLKQEAAASPLALAEARVRRGHRGD